MTIAYFDCFHGAAGDMLLASLLDAGLELAALEKILATLPFSDYTLEHQHTTSHHIRGSRVTVQSSQPQPPRHWADIHAALETSHLPPPIRTCALNVFARLARAEAAIHGVAVEQVHFHEIGAIDSIVDIVGVCAALELFAIEQVYASPLPTGSGWVQTQHGPLPVPAPATLSLLAEVGAPLIPSLSAGELITPTAAAILAELARFEQPPMQIQRVGYGFGHKPYSRLNGLRVWVGQAIGHEHEKTSSNQQQWEGQGEDPEQVEERQKEQDHTSPVAHNEPQQVVEMRCNLDDVTGELIGYVIERLLATGALDAWATPIVMKKGRPAIQLACLAHPGDVERLAHAILRETPTLGVRWETLPRLAAARQSVPIQTAWGTVRLKQKVVDGKVIASMPEYDDCATLAQKHNVPLAHIYQAALQAGQETLS